MKRKPLRPDWRQTPPRRMIPAMSRQQLLLRRLRVTLKVDTKELQRFGEQMVAAAHMIPSSVILSTKRAFDGVMASILDLSSGYYPSAPVIDSMGRIVGVSLVRKRDQ